MCRRLLDGSRRLLPAKGELIASTVESTATNIISHLCRIVQGCLDSVAGHGTCARWTTQDIHLK
jgi:hypothetical protein